MKLKSRLGISLPMLNQPYDQYPLFAHLAEEAGFDSVWDYECYRNPFMTLGLCARTTRRIKLCTGAAAACARSPNEMANAAADVDELSNGRMVLGVGTGGADFAELYNGADISHPLPRMTEYIQALRAIWHHHASDGEALELRGRFHSVTSPPVNIFGPRRRLARKTIPIYLAALKPRMLQMAGAMADGVLGFLNTPRFVTEHVLPNVARGARQAGRDPADIDVASLIICSVDADREAALRLARIQVGIYVAYSVGVPMVEFMGLQEDRKAVLAALMSGGPRALERTTSDALLRTFSIHGTPEEAREQLAIFDGVLPHIVLHMPYVPPVDQAASETAFRNAVMAFAR